MLTTDAIFKAFLEGWFIARGKRSSTIQRYGNLWHLQYSLPMGGRDHEFFIYRTPVAAAVAQVRALVSGTNHWLGVAHLPEEDVAREYAAADYFPSVLETLMVRPPAPVMVTPLPAGMKCQPVSTWAQADWYNRTQKRQAIHPAELEERRLRYYLIFMGLVPIARGRLVLLDGGISSLDGIHVHVAHRRQGIGRALVTQMLSDAAAAGHALNVLSSSEMGYGLYQQLGYQESLKLTLFDPIPHRVIV
ncbi:MAG: GNAT family N-acetyltransferase [Chloroflexi bacterium]|nr:GNAT family N-acetyltransferase [Chloroflexota bacterium]MBP8057069.1 GNAT family N-acetyltransferase [Chloroflexota bacterium]